MKADLHIHSTISDGSNPMRAVFEAAKAAGLTHLSFTEHDTARGVAEAQTLGGKYHISVIPGVEFSAYDYRHAIRAHILGYCLRDTAPIEQLGAPLLRLRHENSLRQIAALNALGYEITEQEVSEKSGPHIYKQHIMHVMVDKGYAESIGGPTYRKLFKNKGPCDFDIPYLDARDAIRAILDAGGIPCLAHPGQQNNFSSIPGLAAAGLKGLEWNHHANGAWARAIILSLAAEYGLLLTGGSDHHGLYEENSPAVGAYTCPAETMGELLYLAEAAI